MKTSDLASFMARKVSPFLTVEVQGGTWSVKGLPGLLVGDRVKRDLGIGDDPLAVALCDGAVFFDPFGFKAANADA